MPETQSDSRDETLEKAKTLWGKAVDAESDVTMSVKISAVETRDAPPTHMHLSVRSLAKAGRELGGSGHPRDSDFQLVRMLGHGGMGVVYEARQCSLDRDIAIKMSRPGEARDRGVLNKFLSEAIVTGELDHPNIVPVYDVGRTSEDALFYAMKKVVGTAWTAVMREKTLDENLHILLAVCDAVAFAHDKGVIHRDIKPQNVMLGAYGEVLVMDWGLAVSVGSAKAETLSGDAGLAGTPAYMPPEMARCDREKIGKASDIYLLGGILYELVTGLRPHGGSNVHACIADAMENHIQPTDKQGELVEIALKAMATEPSQRYTSVKDFQRAIRRYLSHAESLRLSEAADERLGGLASAAPNAFYREATETVAAYQQAIKLWHGNRGAWFGLRRARQAFTLVALERGDLSLAGAQVEAMQAEAARLDVGESEGLEPIGALAARVRKAQAEAAARRRLVRFSVAAAVLAAALALTVVTAAYFMARRDRDNAVAARRRAVEAQRSAVAERDRAAAAEAEEERLRVAAQAALHKAREESYYNAVALAGTRIAEGDTLTAEALLRNATENRRGWEWGLLMYLCNRELVALRGHRGAVLSACFSPDGTRVVTAGHDKTVVVWNAATGVALHAIKTDPVPVVSAAFSPDGRKTLVGTRDGWIKTWDPEQASEIDRVSLAVNGVNAGAVNVSADGTRALTVGRDGSVRLWRTSGGEALFVFKSEIDGRPQAALSPDGRRILMWGGGTSVQIREAGAEGASRTLELDGLVPPVICAAFSADGARLVTTGRDARARVWDAAAGAEVLALRGHEDAVAFASFSPDGTRIVTAGHDATARIWDAADWEAFLSFNLGEGKASCVALSPDGRMVLAAGGEGAARIVDAWTGRRAAVLKGHTGAIAAAVFSPDGRRAFTAGQDKTVRVWDAAAGREIRTMNGHSGPVTGMAIDPEGGRLLTAGPAEAIVWDARDLKLLARQAFKTEVSRQAAFSPDGSRMLVAGVDIEILDAATRAQAARLEGAGGAVTAVAFSPDGRRVLAGDRNGARLRDARTGEEVFELKGHGGVSAAAFSPDGSRLVTGGRGAVKVWDAETGRELLSLPGHAGWMTRVLFDADGARLITADETGLVRIWLGFDTDMKPEDLPSQKERIYTLWSRRLD